MKKTIFFLLVLIVTLSLCACGGEKYIAKGDGWVVDESNTLIISEMEKNKIPNYTYSDPAPWHPYRMLIKTIVIEEGITHIGELAFNSCEAAESVVFPSTLQQIADKAFTYCFALKALNIPNGVNYIGEQAFLQCTALQTVVWPESTASIYPKTFSGCTVLESVTVPNKLWSIHELAFENCTNLKTITLPDKLSSFEESSFQGCTSLVIECSAGSKAEEIAKKYNIPYQLTD